VRARGRWGLGSSRLLGGAFGGAKLAGRWFEGVAAQDRGQHRGEVFGPVDSFRTNPGREVGGGPAIHQGLGGAF
jgi:hypothetical protein